jgi:hypothetical protein
MTAFSHEQVLLTPPPWSIVKKSRPPTLPAKVTTPASGATITVERSVAMSIPRCPAPYGSSGGSKPRMIGPTTGHVHGTAAFAAGMVDTHEPTTTGKMQSTRRHMRRR